MPSKYKVQIDAFFVFIIGMITLICWVWDQNHATEWALTATILFIITAILQFTKISESE